MVLGGCFMKPNKIIALLCVTAILLSFASCNSKNDNIITPGEETSASAGTTAQTPEKVTETEESESKTETSEEETKAPSSSSSKERDDVVENTTSQAVSTTKPSNEVTTKPNAETTTKPSNEVTTKPNVEVTTKPIVETDIASEPKTEAPEEKPAENLVDGMRPEFKKAMDAYEEFYNEYCEFLKEYNKNPADFTLLAKYGEMLEKAGEADKALAEWDDGEMNDAETKYYLEVTNRISKKLLDVTLTL